MSQVIATVEQAARWALGDPVPDEAWNPIYRALLEGKDLTAQAAPDPAALALVRRHLTSPALLVVAVTDGAGTSRLRLGPAPSQGTVERSVAAAASRWSELPAQQMPDLVASLLAEYGVATSAPRLTTDREADGLRLTPEQNVTVRAALASGLTPADAYAAVPDLDVRLRDALTATGPRISLSLTLHDPQGRVSEKPVNWSRLWVQGRHGLYRLDAPTVPGGAIHAVGGGDVLGTLLPVLEEGLRFSAACAASGDVR